MRILLGICIGALLGALAVSVLKGMEIRRLETEVRELEERGVESSGRASSAIATGLIPGLSNALASNENGEAIEARPSENADQSSDLESADAGPNARRSRDPEPLSDERGGRRQRWSTPEGFEASVLAQRMRRAQMKQALIERHRLRRDDVERIEKLQQTLNEKLAPYGEEVSLLAEEGERNPKFSTVLTLTQDVTGILAESQQELDDIVGEPMGIEDRETQVWNLIDLETFRSAAEALQRREVEQRRQAELGKPDQVGP